MKSLVKIFLVIIVVSLIGTAIYRCPSLKNHHNFECDVCGRAAIDHYYRNGTEYELCPTHYSRWDMKDTCDSYYYQEPRGV